jgi:hypothetical protein
MAGLLATMLALAWSSAAAAEGRWISAPGALAADARKAPIALQFRREFELSRKPKQFPVRVSADNRFILFVNGRRAASGPSRGDLQHWRYARLDLAPYLSAGRNVVAAQVWNDQAVAPVAQISARTSFLLTAEDAAQGEIDTGPGWRVRVDPSRTVQLGVAQLMRQTGPNYYAAGAPESFDGAAMSWDWAAGRTTAGSWASAAPAVATGETPPWTLVADPLPAQRYAPVDPGKVVRAAGAQARGFPRSPLRIPPNSEATLLVDAGRVLSAYPQLVLSGGREAKVTITYAEALYGPGKVRFADRARVDDGQALGLTDTIRPDGGSRRTYAPFWWRTWRFVELRVKTGAEPLTLEGFAARETGYPFLQRGRFVSDDPQLNEIWRVGWRTTQVDAHETFMDTAYWEQLQYTGDTRIEALISYAVAGDPRLAAQALDAFDASRVVDGLPLAAWPSSRPNSIPPFALIWIGMLHDYWMAQPDVAPIKRNLPGARAVLDWYAPYVTEEGLVRETPGWRFIDWRPGLGEQPKKGDAPKPPSCIVSLFYLGALQQAADLERAVGDPARADADLAQARRVHEGVQAQCWDAQRGLYADTPEKRVFSQHANVLAVLYDVAPPALRRPLLERVMVPGQGIAAPEGITGVTYYFAFYLARALDHAGMGDGYLDLLKTWRTLLGQHFTTWPENPDPSRSDSHAWSAHPTADLLALVAGVQSAAPGFRAVRVAPHLGGLKRLDAVTAHPDGLIETRYIVSSKGLQARIALPPGLRGEFVWRGEVRALHPGLNRLSLAAR